MLELQLTDKTLQITCINYEQNSNFLLATVKVRVFIGWDLELFLLVETLGSAPLIE